MKISKRNPSRIQIQKKAQGSYRHGDLKNVLIQAAIKLIDERREVTFTIRELASLTGVTHAAAYRHYKSKKEILIAIAIIGFNKMQNYFDQATKKTTQSAFSNHNTAHPTPSSPQQPPPVKQSLLVTIGMAYVTFAIENPTLFRVMFHSDLNDCRTEPELGAVGAKTYQTLVNAVIENISNGTYASSNEQIFSLAAWSLVHGASTLFINGLLKQETNPTNEDMRQWAEWICQILETGMIKRN